MFQKNNSQYNTTMRKWRCPKVIFLPILILGFFSITYSARADTATINAALGDGDATYSWGGCNQATWSQIRNISSASSRSYVSGERFPAIWAGQCANGVDVVIRRAFFPFDTSALPDGAVVTAATLNMYVPSVTNALNDGNDFLSVVKSNQASTVTLLVADYRIADFTEGSSRIDISSISPGGWVSLPLNAAGRSWISTTGNTMLAVLDGHDILNIYNPAGGQNQVGMRFANYGGAYIPYLQITYTVTQSNGASFVSQTAPPLTMAGGATANVSVTMQNTGTATWTQAGLYRLGSQNPQDNNTWGLGRVDLPVASVAPGSSATFNFTVTAPSAPGTYNFQWRMVQDGVEWFGANSTNVSITVSAPADTTPPAPPTVSLGSAMQNSLTASWSGATDNVAVTGYRLDVSTSAAFGTFVSGYNNLDVGNVVSRLISGLIPSTTYYARVRAYDAAGNTSANSNVPSLATMAPPPPPNVSGYAWADDSIGWIKMSGTATDGSPYGVLVSSASPGVLSGYAWANPNDGVQNHIGWISFNETELGGCSSGTCKTELNRSTGAVTGWARACSVFANGCFGALRSSSELGGWDGWIRFGSGGNYTQPVMVSGCSWDGYAWGGGTVFGWIHFRSGALYGVSGSGDGCVTLFDYSLSNSGNITVDAGSSGSNTITQVLVSGASSSVTLSASGLPAGASVSGITSNPCSPNCSNILTIETLPSTLAGIYPITVTGSLFGKTTNFNLIVNAAPPTPSGLSIDQSSLNTCDTIRLIWNDVAGEDTYQLERNDGGWHTIATPVANDTDFSDDTIVQNTSYSYRVSACNAFGCSLPSSSVSAINQSPLANFLWAPLQVRANQTATFTDASVAYGAGVAIGAWQWTFEDGNPATAITQNATTRFLDANPAVKAVTLMVTDNHLPTNRTCSLTQNVSLRTGSTPPRWEEEPPE